MVCLLCNGDGSIGGGGGVSIINRLLLGGGGSTSKYKLGRGVAEEITNLPTKKNSPPSPPQADK